MGDPAVWPFLLEPVDHRDQCAILPSPQVPQRITPGLAPATLVRIGKINRWSAYSRPQNWGEIAGDDPQTQLARVLEAAGATDKAKAIRYARFEHRRDHDTSLNGFDRFWLDLKKYFVGYGVYPERALCWFAALVVLGAALVRFSATTSVRRWMGLWYSLDNALPLIQTTERFRNVEHGRPGLDHFFQFQKVFGFVPATVLVAALALLGGS